MVKELLSPRWVGLALGLALVLGCLPAEARAGMVGSLRSDQQPLGGRDAQLARVQRLLAEQKVADALLSVGLTPDEVRSRLATLSDAELVKLADNLETIHKGKGTVVALLLIAVILLGVLIYMQIEAA